MFCVDVVLFFCIVGDFLGWVGWFGLSVGLLVLWVLVWWFVLIVFLLCSYLCLDLIVWCLLFGGFCLVLVMVMCFILLFVW